MTVVAVAAHEVGHATLHQRNEPMPALRHRGSMASATLVHLVTLPVELDADFRQALPVLIDGHYIQPGDEAAVRRVLRAAALTCVAGSRASLLNLARWLGFLAQCMGFRAGDRVRNGSVPNAA